MAGQDSKHSMAERWRYAGRKHPPYCTCANCKGDSPRSHDHQPQNQLRATLEQWRSKNFDPHFILGIPPNSSRQFIVETHRRWILIYHPDKHQNDPVATELTKRLNAARDELLGEGRRGSRSQREQRQRQEEAQRQRERESERRRQEEARRQRAREAEQRTQAEAQRRERAREAERRRQEEARQRAVHDAEMIMREAARRRQHSPVWSVLAIALSSIIAAYLILTVTAPDATDSLMQEWANLFS